MRVCGPFQILKVSMKIACLMALYPPACHQLQLIAMAITHRVPAKKALPKSNSWFQFRTMNLKQRIFRASK